MNSVALLNDLIMKKREFSRSVMQGKLSGSANPGYC